MLTVLRDEHGNTYAPQAAEDVRDKDGKLLLQSRNVQNRLHELGLKTKKPALTKEQITARLRWRRLTKIGPWTVGEA